jgi:6-phosphofructokinase 1
MKKPSRKASPKAAQPAPRNAFYAQSGGVTAVINASAAGVIQTAARHPKHIGKVYAGRHGIVGALHEDLIDCSKEDKATIEGLKHTPAGAFGSARFKLKGLDKNRAEYERLIEVFKAHDIGYFFYNGGNDSMDTAHKVAEMGKQLGYPITCIGVPKTVDNDLPFTDCCPGFGSVAKYVAISTLEASLDVASMAKTSTKVFVMEVMGRHAGWIAAAGGLAGKGRDAPPHVILFPEIAFDQAAFLARVKETVERVGVGPSSPTPAPRTRSATPSSAASARWSPTWCARRTATSTTGRWPTTCSAPRATSPPRPMSSRPMRWARRPSSSP